MCRYPVVHLVGAGIVVGCFGDLIQQGCISGQSSSTTVMTKSDPKNVEVGGQQCALGQPTPFMTVKMYPDLLDLGALVTVTAVLIWRV
jgi:hypothetical protein